MTRWFRFYDDAVNDPKLLRLPDDLYRAWTILLCFASKHEGVLPPADDIALALRIKPAKVCEWITKLVRGGLIDQNGTTFSPHNWNGRQYKSDVSTERVKRFRNGKRNVSETASETPPEQKQNRADSEQSRADAAQRLIEEISERWNFTDIARAAIWIEKGYSGAMILETIASIMARGQKVSSAAYFDEPLKSAHANRMPSPSERQAPDMDKTVKLWATTGVWSRWAGPEPGQINCKATREQLAKHGFAPDGTRMQNA